MYGKQQVKNDSKNAELTYDKNVRMKTSSSSVKLTIEHTVVNVLDVRSKQCKSTNFYFFTEYLIE